MYMCVYEYLCVIPCLCNTRREFYTRGTPSLEFILYHSLLNIFLPSSSTVFLRIFCGLLLSFIEGDWFNLNDW